MARKLKNIELNRLSVDEFKQREKFPVVLLLDNVRSMHNVGSVFRTADAFAVEELLLSGITGTPPHREITKTAIGAEIAVKWSYHPEAAVIIREMRNRGYKVVGLEQTTDSVSLETYLPDSSQKLLVIVGNEVDGIEDDLIDLCDEIVEIPQFGTKHSLNVAVSTGVFLWHVVRKWIE